MTTQLPTPTRLDAQAVFTAMSQGWNAADAERTAATYAADGRLVTPFGVALHGRAAITDAFGMLFGGASVPGLPAVWAGMFVDTTTEIVVDDVRALTEGLVVVEATQTTDGPLPPLHLTAILAHAGDKAEILECRPYPFMALPPA